MVLEGYEDEYLDDDEGGAMNDSAEQAIAQGALGSKDGPSTVRQSTRHVCWASVFVCTLLVVAGGGPS